MKRIIQLLLATLVTAVLTGCVTGYEAPSVDLYGGTHMTLNEKLLFARGSAVLKKSSGKELDRVAAELKKADGKFTVQGYTDTVGSEAANMKLSIKRAEAVKAALVKRGIKAERVRVRGYGETRLLVKDAKTAADHQKNRRVVIVYTDDTTAAGN